MARTFVISDLHLSHKRVCAEINHRGEKLRPWDDPREMDRAITERWNADVRPNDLVYILGDVALSRLGLRVLEALRGRKRLVKGNHDTLPLREYTPYFEDIRATHSIGTVLLTHIPVHPACLDRWRINIHGHLHDEVVRLPSGEPDARYFCVSAEHTGFKPVLLDEVMAEAEQRLKWLGA